jgi:hypothetical protein
MKHFRSLSLAAALLCLAVSVSTGWLWHALSESTYEAHGRLALRGDPFSESDASSRGPDAAGALDSLTADRVLSPEVLAAAADLLHDRGVALSLASPFDSETDYLLGRSRLEPAGNGGADEVRIVCTATQADETLQILTAIVDAFVAGAAAPQPPPVSASDNPEHEERQLAHAIERQERTIVALAADQQKSRLALNEAAGEGPGELDSRLAAARSAVVDAARLLDDARHDFEKQLPADSVAARLPEGPARTKLLDRLSQAKLQEELRRQEALAVKSSSVYGRNHPRLIELREQIEQLRRQVAGLPVQPGDLPDSAQDSDQQTIVLRTLEGTLAAALAEAREVETLQGARNDRAATLQKLEAELGDARQELAFLRGEHDGVRQQVESARREQARRSPAVIEPPTLSPDPIAPQAGLQMAVSCVVGMVLYLFILWQFRSRLVAPVAAGRASRAAPAPFARAPVQKRAPVSAPAPPLVQIPQSFAPAARKQRSRAHDEQRLARLKMLSTRGSAAVKWE